MKPYLTVNMHTCGLVEIYEYDYQADAKLAAKRANEYTGCPELGVSRMDGACEVTAYCFTKDELKRTFEVVL